jgi:hypothetical protein
MAVGGLDGFDSHGQLNMHLLNRVKLLEFITTLALFVHEPRVEREGVSFRLILFCKFSPEQVEQILNGILPAFSGSWIFTGF